MSENGNCDSLSLVNSILLNQTLPEIQDVDLISRMNIANILSGSPISPTSYEWQKIMLEKQVIHSMNNAPLQNPWAFNLIMQPHLQNRLQTILGCKGFGIENPLDLSNKNQLSSSQMSMLFNGLQETKPETTAIVPPTVDISLKSTAVRRNYTLEDLTQAVEDIRQGKLGTRRASVVYGIPRSTLRNKIYKLEAEGAITSKVRRTKYGTINKIDNEKPTKNCRTPSNSSSTSPKPTLYPSSPDSTDSSVEGNVFNQDNSSFKPITEDSSNLTWVDTLWQNLFKSHNTKMTANVMSLTGDNNTLIFDETKEGNNQQKVQKINRETNSEEWRRSRPKRGQYRRYDKHALDEAVKSVRRGEMSVHRAGSFYGVPHSTLEYKVKERNLLRKKKDTVSNECLGRESMDDNSSIVSSTTEKQNQDESNDAIKSQN